MDVEPAAAAAAAVLLNCGGGALKAAASARTANPSQEPDATTAATPASAGKEEEPPAPLRRGLAVARARRRAGPATPSPSWKLEASPRRPEVEAATVADVAAAAAATAGRSSSAAASASARQLGATLWEIQDVIRAAGSGRRIRRRARRGLAADRDGDVDRLLYPDEQYYRVSSRDVLSDSKPQSSGGCGGHLSTTLMEHDKLHENRCHTRLPLSPASYTSSMGAATINLVSPTRSLDFRARSREAGCNIKTSTELLKVLNRIWSLEEQHAADVSAVKGLKSELQHSQARVQELMQERQRYHYEMDSLVRQVTEDKMTRKNKDQEKVRAALHSLKGELEDERHLRKHSESLHRKLGKELSEMKSAFLKAVKDLEKEKKSTRLLEDLCDEFAFGIRNYEEEVRVLKQRHVKEYRHKFDKSIVHISEAWLDERMQMQNADSRAEDSAGKNTITERLSAEIHNFLHARRSNNPNNANIHTGNEKQDASLCRQSLESVRLNGATSAPRLAEDDENSVSSDLHCFELNMLGGAIRNQDLAAARRRVTGCMYSPMRRLEYSNGVSVEGSRISNTLPCSRKDKAKSSSSREQLNASTPEISSRNDDKIIPINEQNETVMIQVSRQLHDDLLKIKSEAPQHAFLGQKSHDNHYRLSQFGEYATSGDLHNLRSPARQLNNQCTLLDYEISESSPMHPLGTKENTLKAKLLQARLEGQHARIRVSGYPLTSTRRK